jgi:hypothetical protein
METLKDGGMIMKRSFIALNAIGLIFLIMITACVKQSPSAKFRVGVYDNRAIAIAYAGSEYNPVGKLMEDYSKARESGDTARAAELEALGKKHQRALHRQGFGRVPVDDILALVKDKLPDVALKANVDAIAWQCNYNGPNVEVVDITRELAAVFDSTERTMNMVDEMKQHPPLDLDDIEQHQDD